MILDVGGVCDQFAATGPTPRVELALIGSGPALAVSMRSTAASLGEEWSTLGELRFRRPLPKLSSRRPNRRAAHRFARKRRTRVALEGLSTGSRYTRRSAVAE